MSKQISNWLVVPIILIVFVVLVGMSIKIGFDKGIETEHQPAYNQGYLEGYDRGYQEAWKVGYDKGKLDGGAPYKSSTNETISIDKALAILAEAKQNHLDWAARPDLIVRQDENTGDTSFNLKWAGNYADLEELVKRLAE